MQVLARRLLHPGGHRRRKERRLPVRGGAGDDPLDVGREAAVEHLVRLVEHEEADAVQPDGALVEQVEHAAGSADHHVHAAAQLVALRTEGAAAGDHQRLQTARGAQLFDNAGHLDSQLARRGQHQRLHLLELGIDDLDQRQGEGQGLAGAGARLADDVAAIEQERQHRGLDRGGIGDPHVGEHRQ